MASKKTPALIALQESATKNRGAYSFLEVNTSLLETVPYAAETRSLRSLTTAIVVLRLHEFTSVCPVTGQPDFGEIDIAYTPLSLLVESKSLKLYAGSYRNAGIFHEAVVRRFAGDLEDLLSPGALVVRGRFAPRGGVSIWPVVHIGNLNRCRAMVKTYFPEK
jgi:7-cyano-7-deazaguanine reductase